jgi:hypothetical protein
MIAVFRNKESATANGSNRDKHCISSWLHPHAVKIQCFILVPQSPDFRKRMNQCYREHNVIERVSENKCQLGKEVMLRIMDDDTVISLLRIKVWATS